MAPPDHIHLELAGRLATVMRGHTKRMTQTQLSMATGVTQKHISQVLNGHVAASTRTWATLIDAAARCRPPCAFHAEDTDVREEGSDHD
jgi:transcriptional regulator with XRE-family HTH domain